MKFVEQVGENYNHTKQLLLLMIIKFSLTKKKKHTARFTNFLSEHMKEKFPEDRFLR